MPTRSMSNLESSFLQTYAANGSATKPPKANPKIIFQLTIPKAIKNMAVAVSNGFLHAIYTLLCI